jgi:ribosomal protein L11 methyltransferase
MEWRQFVMNLGALPVDAVEKIFARHGAQAVTLTDAGDNPMLEPGPGETPLWNDSRITGLFSPSADFDGLRRDLLGSFALTRLPEHRVEILEDRAWEREWLKDFHPMRFGNRLWVCPGEFEVNVPEAIVVQLDPGLAFGTGTHPTTALCLAWLDDLDLDSKQVLDFGCGSGILSVAALLLGADAVTAVDIDPQAITATGRNAERNGVAGRVRTTGDAGDLDAAYDVAIANILAAPLIEHARTICERLVTGGDLGLSGILEHQVAAVQGAYREWIDFDATAIRSPWARLTGRKI